MLNVCVQLGDFQSVELPLLYKCFPVSNVHLLRLELAFFVSSLLLTDLSDTLQLRLGPNVMLHPSFLSTMNLEENFVMAPDALIDNFPCSKSFLIFDHGCQPSVIRFLPFSSLFEKV